MGGLLGGRPGIRAAGSLREVLIETPAVDHHAHGILRAPPASLDEFRGLFSESPDPRQWRHVATGVTYRRAISVLASHLGCEPDEEAVYARRLATDPLEYASSLLRATRTELLLVDEGFPSADVGTTPRELGELAGCAARPVMRIEGVAERVGIGALDALRDAIAGARAHGYAALKTIAAYRGGLDLDALPPPPARTDPHPGGEQPDTRHRGGEAPDTRRPGGSECGFTRPRTENPDTRAGHDAECQETRLAGTPLRKVLLAALEANEETGDPLPVQVHTGFGDSDLLLPAARPGLLKPLIERFPRTTWVLLHCYPFVREAGWLAHVYANVFFDVSLTIPHVARPSEALYEALELAPVSKLLYATDASRTPELYLLGARWWRESLAEVLPSLLASEDDAIRAARMILRENAHAVYGLADQ